jgi:hypothetical protein
LFGPSQKGTICSSVLSFFATFFTNLFLFYIKLLE